MSEPRDHSRLEELAALYALDLLDEASRTELYHLARDPETVRLVNDSSEAAAMLAYEAREVAPPPELKKAILRELPSPGAKSKIVRFAQWVPFAVAACLMVLAINQAKQILSLKAQLEVSNTDVSRLTQSNALMGLKLATLEAKDTSYSSTTVLVAWDPYRHSGVVSLQNLPPAPAGHDYQLWVLDPEAESPISAGILKPADASHQFGVHPLTTQGPGFAISLEPTGGRPEPTGPILFAVAPGQ